MNKKACIWSYQHPDGARPHWFINIYGLAEIKSHRTYASNHAARRAGRKFARRFLTNLYLS